jgi:hypothetical protein
MNTDNLDIGRNPKLLTRLTEKQYEQLTYMEKLERLETLTRRRRTSSHLVDSFSEAPF